MNNLMKMFQITFSICLFIILSSFILTGCTPKINAREELLKQFSEKGNSI